METPDSTINIEFRKSIFRNGKKKRNEKHNVRNQLSLSTTDLNSTNTTQKKHSPPETPFHSDMDLNHSRSTSLDKILKRTTLLPQPPLPDIPDRKGKRWEVMSDGVKNYTTHSYRLLHGDRSTRRSHGEARSDLIWSDDALRFSPEKRECGRG